jgi:hypothetical protein
MMQRPGAQVGRGCTRIDGDDRLFGRAAGALQEKDKVVDHGGDSSRCRLKSQVVLVLHADVGRATAGLSSPHAVVSTSAVVISQPNSNNTAIGVPLIVAVVVLGAGGVLNPFPVPLKP